MYHPPSSYTDGLYICAVHLFALVNFLQYAIHKNRSPYPASTKLPPRFVLLAQIYV